MAAALAANLTDACARYDAHRALKHASSGMYAALTAADKSFIKAWVSLEIHDIRSKSYGRLTPTALQQLLLKRWTLVIAKAPTLPRDTVMYRAVTGVHAAQIAKLKVGGTIALDRYSSFAHSPDMVRKYAGFLVEPGAKRETVVVLCVTVARGTPFVFIGAMDFTGFGKRAYRPGMEEIDNTQGEVVLGPMTLSKTARNRTVKMCEGTFAEELGRTCSVIIVEAHASAGLTLRQSCER